MHYIKNFPEITINFARINHYVFIAIIFFVALVIGKSSYTDVYDRFNKLPDDRSELTPIKKIVVSILNESELYVRVFFDAITKLTTENIYQNINAHVENENISLSIYSKNADTSTIKSDYFEFSYKLPFYGKNVSVQLFLFDTPINDVQFYDIVRNENNDEDNQSTMLTQNSLKNVCLSKDQMQIFFKGKPTYNLKTLQIPNYQEHYDFHTIRERGIFHSKKAILICDDQVKNDYFSVITTTLYSYLNHLEDNYRKFICNRQNISIFRDIFDLSDIFSEKTNCFSELEIYRPTFNTEAVYFLKAQINEQIKAKESSLELNNDTPFISYFTREGSSIERKNDLFQSICPNCELNEISASRDSISISDFYKISNSKVIIGIHSEKMISAISMQNSNQDGVIIDILPSELLECGSWIKNMRAIAKTIIYSMSSSNDMYREYCNKNECYSSACAKLLDGSFYIDSDKVLKAIQISSNDCPSNLIAVNQSGVFCLKY